MAEPSVSAAFDALDGGLLTTIQDAGRPHAMPLGVPRGGASDPWALAVANIRCGNPRGAPALELTLVPPRLRALRPATIAVAGADLGLWLRGPSGDRPLPPGTVTSVHPDDELVPGTGPRAGCRAMLAIRGGFVVEPVLGSASTALGAGFGGLDGRALRAGDRLFAADMAEDQHRPARVPAIPDDGLDDPPATRRDGIGLLPGPHLPDPALLEALIDGAWTVAPTSDRMGLRLDGPPLAVDPTTAIVSHGVTWGTVQVPPDGSPIVLLADHQPTGGYPVPAVVPLADRPRLAQLRPGDRVRFRLVTRDEAVAASRRQRDALDALERACRDDRAWDAAWRSATG